MLCSDCKTSCYIIFLLIAAAAKAEHVEENEEPFVAPLGLNVPSDVELVSVVCVCVSMSYLKHF